MKNVPPFADDQYPAEHPEPDKQVLLEQIKAQEDMLAQTTGYLLQIQEQLEESRRALYIQNKNLEQIVEKRTAELKKVVSRLEREVLQREQAQQRLSVANSELNMLLYRSSHDFKGPICTAFGLLSLVDPQKVDPEVWEYLQLLRKPLNKLDSLTKTITLIADFKDNNVRVEPIDLPELLQRLLSDFKQRMGSDYPEVVTSITFESIFRSDPLLLESIFTNLLDNAFRYRVKERCHQVTICIQAYYKQVRVSISDTGTGIPDTFQSRVFDMFFRGSELATGSGLGLYLTKLSVEKLNGNISIKSELSKGTTVTVILPNL